MHRADEAPAARPGPAEFLREQHRRLFDLVRKVGVTRDADERIEFAAALGDELCELIALERGPLKRCFQHQLPAFFEPDCQADVRRAQLAVLAEQVASAASDGRVTRALVDEIFECASAHVAAAIRVVLPLVEALPADDAAALDTSLRDHKERMAEH